MSAMSPRHERRRAVPRRELLPLGGSAAAPHQTSIGSTQEIPIRPSFGAPHFVALPPLALYVHIPWCLKKCPYCDFNSHQIRGEISNDDPPEAVYVDALLTDIELALPQIWGRRVTSLFIGGGTPSLFSVGAIDRLLSGIRARLPLAPTAEVTLEANPGTFEREKFEGLRAAGVNRLSLGIQSFNAHHLRALGRVHDDMEARRAAEAAVAIFGNVNLDLMFALPGQEVRDALEDVQSAVRFAAPHLSFYHLTLEPNTLFHRYPPRLPDEDMAADIEQAVDEVLAASGYVHYETSAHARTGHECQHNVNYWQFGDYLGIGAGAHSKLSFADRVLRQVRWKQPAQYLEQIAVRSPLMEEAEVTRDAIGFEFMLNALRLTAGVPTRLFAERTGYPLTLVQREMREAVQQGLLVADPQVICPTPLGHRFQSDLQAIFLRDRAPETPAKAAPVALPQSLREHP